MAATQQGQEILPLDLSQLHISDAGHKENPIYQPLDESKHEIRLLQLLPEDGNARSFHCTLSTTSLRSWSRQLSTRPVYTALSYCWESQSSSRTIILNGIKVSITKNLKLALEEFWKRGKLTLWVDALCINQADENERGHQILRMRDIYSSASETLAWLGPDRHLMAKRAFEHLSQLSSDVSALSERGESLDPGSDPNNPGWLAIASLLSLQYWHRTWIIQELSTSQSVTLLWGSEALPFSHLLLVLLAIQPIKKKKTRGISSVYIHAMGIARILRLTQRNHGKSLPRLVDLLHLSCQSRASEPRDKIFGVLGLSRDGETLIGFPNYSDPLEKIVMDMTRNMFLSTRGKVREVGILIFKASMARTERDDRDYWPSWVIDWPSFWNSSHGYLWSSKSNRGLKGEYDATGMSKSEVYFSEDGRVLHISGFIFDTIGSISDSHEAGQHNWTTDIETGPDVVNADGATSTDQLREMSRNPYGSEHSTWDAIWRTIIVDRTADREEQAPLSWAHDFGRVWSSRSSPENYGRTPPIRSVGAFQIHGRSVNKWAEKFSLPVSEEESKEFVQEREELLESLIDLNLNIAFSRRLMQTTKGYIGLTHALSQVSDCICLLNGCVVPVILRRCASGFTVVGEAYVHGIMNGEAWSTRNKNSAEEFLIF